MDAVKNKGGRPSSFTQAKADKICNLLVEGKSLRKICKADDLPACSTVFKWLIENKEFSEQYAYARELQADTLFDEILDIADQGSGDVQRARLRIDTRKWMVGKLRPKKYGESSQIKLTGADDDQGNPTAVQITIVDPKVENLTDPELIAIASGGVIHASAQG